MKRTVIASLVAAALVAAAVAGEDREKKVRSDKEKVEAEGEWIYADLPRGVAEAKKSGKPLLVVFRCIPCEACAQIDEDVVTRDPKVAKLLDQFVCVRIPQMNGVDLSLFQFDLDQSWAAFLMNADMTIYGRYGTRSSQKDSTDDVSLEGFSKALEGALELHARFPEVRASLQVKRGNALAVEAPEDFPSFGGKFKPTLDYAEDKKVVPSCIHCHQTAEAQRRFYRDAGKEIPGRLLAPYPNPKDMGLVMDPKERARVANVIPDSPAAKDGFAAGDDILAVNETPILSIADLQWVLNGFPTGGRTRVNAMVRRGDKTVSVLFSSPMPKASWDISWRASSWDLRRMTTGGMLLETLPQDERTKLRIPDGKMALRAKHVGQYGEHAAAKNAGFVKGDVIVGVNGRDDVMTETEWLTWLVNAKKPGENVKVTVLRDGKRLEMTLPMQ